MKNKNDAAGTAAALAANIIFGCSFIFSKKAAVYRCVYCYESFDTYR